MKQILSLCALLTALCAFADSVDMRQFSKAVTFVASGYDGMSTLENFPVLVRLSEGIKGFSYADIGDTTNSAYANLRFVNANHANLDYEIEIWDTNGTSFVWVSLPSLSGKDTAFSACWSPQTGYTLPDVHPTNVWISAGYVGVWHLNDIIKNYSSSYMAYDDPLWGHMFLDSTGRGAHATKGTTTWNTSLMNVPNDNSGYHFPESLGRANGTLGANAYTPFIIPQTSKGGGAGDWTFSSTGYSTESWVFPFGSDHAVFISGQSVGVTATNFTRVSTNLVRIAARDWGGSGVGWNSEKTSERIWHFVSTVWTPTSSADPTLLYGTSNDDAPSLLQSRDCHATDQFATEGMRFTAGTGQEYGVDEMRVRRGLSTPDWIQANWDTQRVGTDFLSVSSALDPREPSVTAVSENSATVSCAYSFAGTGDSAKAIFVNFATKATNEVVVSDLAHPSATATGLSSDADYDARFVVKSGDDIVLETLVASFVTAGRPVLNPKDYKYSVTFTASGYDGSETLEHFPVLVHLSETTVPGFSYAGIDPANIRFTAVDGSLIPHEVETWDTTGLSTIWVGLPAVSGTDTTFTMYWKPLANAAGVAAQPAYRVWKYAGYLAVWHVNDSVQGPNARQLADSSGYGMMTTNYNDGHKAPFIVTNAAQSANGSAWFRHRNAYWGDATTDWTKFGVTPEQTADWNFSETGYSVETWARPAWLNSNDHGVMFCTSLDPDNTSNWNALNALCVRNDRAGFECDWKTYYKNGAWSGDETNEWHYVAGVWAAAGSGVASVCYEARADLPAGELKTLVSSTDVAACDFIGRHMSLVGGNPPPRPSGYQSYQVDEMRVRRGRSSEAWIQANWDTQRIGTDFLTAGEVKNRNPALVIVVR